MNWDIFLILFSLILVIYPLVVLYINYHIPKLTSEQVDKSDSDNGNELLKKLIGQHTSLLKKSTGKTVYNNWGDNTLGVLEQYRLAMVGHRADIAGELNSKGFALKESKIVYTKSKLPVRP